MRLEIVYIKTEHLRPLGNNPRKAKDPLAVCKLKKLIQAHGFQNPLQVWSDGNETWEILCGNYRFYAGRELGMAEFPCIVYQGSRPEALARAISDNKANEWTEWKDGVLLDNIKQISVSLEDIEITGFAKEEINISGPGGVGDEGCVYPIVAKMGEKYDYVIILCENEIDFLWLKEKLQLRVEKSYKNSNLGESRVIKFERFRALWGKK